MTLFFFAEGAEQGVGITRGKRYNDTSDLRGREGTELGEIGGTLM